MGKIYTQPQQGGLILDPANQFAKRLRFASSLSNPLDYVTKKSGSLTNAPTKEVSQKGLARRFVTASSQVLDFANAPPLSVSGWPITVVCWLDPTVAFSSGYHVFYSFSWSGAQALLGTDDPTAYVANTVSMNGGGVSGFSKQNSKLHHNATVFRNGSFSVYENGKLGSGVTVSGGYLAPAAGNHSVGCRLNQGTPYYCSAAVQDLYIFEGELTQKEIQSLYEDHNQIFKAPQRTIFLLAGAGSLTTTAINATTANAVGSISSGPRVGSEIAATTANAVGSINSLSVNISNSARGTVDLANCSLVANGLTPTIKVKNRWISDDNSSGARMSYFKVEGVNGLTPVFEIDKTNMELPNNGGKIKWSYTGGIGTWSDFTTTTFETSPSVHRCSNSAAFNQDAVYVSMQYPWLVSYTLPWIQSLEASGYVSDAPSSSGNTYVFGTRTATTDGATSGAGNAIASQPLYSFKISSGVGNAPDGNPKRNMVLMSGVHPSEDVGSYALKGAVEFLVSADSQAVTIRSWFNIFVYPLVSAAGRSGGGTRTDFEDSHKLYDANRHWNDSSLESATKHKTAFTTDFGSDAVVFMDFHGLPLAATGGWLDYILEPTAAYSGFTSRWLTAIQTYRPTQTVTEWYSIAENSSDIYFLSNKATRFSLTVESPFWCTYSIAGEETYGADHMRAVAFLAAAGDFIPSISAITATTANAVGSLASKSTSKTVISATTDNAVGNIESANAGTCATLIVATTANATGSIASKSTAKTAIAATTANSIGSIASVSFAGTASAINATTANAVGAINGYSTSKTTISATLAGVFGSINSATQVPATSAINATTANAIGSILSMTANAFVIPTARSKSRTIFSRRLPNT